MGRMTLPGCSLTAWLIEMVVRMASTFHRWRPARKWESTWRCLWRIYTLWTPEEFKAVHADFSAMHTCACTRVQPWACTNNQVIWNWQRWSTKLSALFSSSWWFYGRPLPAVGVFCDDGPSAKYCCVSKQIAFVFLKYLIRSILHSRKYVCVGFLRSLNEVINTWNFKLTALMIWYFWKHTILIVTFKTSFSPMRM